MKHLVMIVLVGSLGVPVAAYAQGCPAGTYPWSGNGVFTCLPDPNYNQQQPQPPPPTPSPKGKWQTRWGAIATDGIRGTLGTASDMQTKASAEKTAIEDCRNKGGTQCVLNVSYGNACGAMFVGDHGFSVNTGDTVDEANNAARQACSAKDQNCHAYYSNCSKPALVQ